VEVPILKVLPQREADIKGETAQSPSEGGVAGASGIEDVGGKGGNSCQ